MKIGRYTYTGLSHSRRTPVPERPPAPVLPTLREDEAPPPPAPAPKPKRKALLIGISYDYPYAYSTSGSDEGAQGGAGGQGGYAPLKGPHADVAAMRKLLVGRYGYAEGDIVTLLDSAAEDGDVDPDGKGGGQLQPTRVNILRAIDDLVRGARKGDRFFFHYCGHTTQIENRSNSEEDGMDECLVPIDGEANRIMDNELRRHLVAALPVGSTLVAVFDSCHSASLLDLAHFRCNRVYVPWLSKGRRRSDERWNAVVRKHALPLLPLSRAGTSTNADPAAASPAAAPTPVSTRVKRKSTLEPAATPTDRAPKRKPTRRPASIPVTPIAPAVEEDELVPTRPNTPLLSPHDDARRRLEEYGHGPLVTTRRIYEAARTSPTRVRAWRTEVGALDVDVDVDVEDASAPFGDFGGVRSGTGKKVQGEKEKEKGLKRAGTDALQQLMKGTRDGEKEKGEKPRKRASLPGAFRGLGLARGRGRNDASPDPWTPTSRGGKRGSGSGSGSGSRNPSRQRRTTVTRARAVSVAVRPSLSVGAGLNVSAGAGDGGASGIVVGGEGKENAPVAKRAVPKRTPTSMPAPAAPSTPAASGRPSLRLAVPHQPPPPPQPQTAEERPPHQRATSSWLEDERECESPAPVWVCQGWNCRDAGCKHEGAEDAEGKAEVISLASCKDYQLTWEDASGGSMTRELVRILERDPHPTLRALVTNVSHALHRMTLERHLEIRNYKRELKKYTAWLKRHPQHRGAPAPHTPTSTPTPSGTTARGTPSLTESRASSAAVLPLPLPEEEEVVAAERVVAPIPPVPTLPRQPQAKAKSEGFVGVAVQEYDMDNFQNPQVASHGPLDMERPWSM